MKMRYVLGYRKIFNNFKERKDYVKEKVVV